MRGRRWRTGACRRHRSSETDQAVTPAGSSTLVPYGLFALTIWTTPERVSSESLQGTFERTSMWVPSTKPVLIDARATACAVTLVAPNPGLAADAAGEASEQISSEAAAIDANTLRFIFVRPLEAPRQPYNLSFGRLAARVQRRTARIEDERTNGDSVSAVTAGRTASWSA